MGAGTFQKAIRLVLKNERRRRENRGAEGTVKVGSGRGIPIPSRPRV